MSLASSSLEIPDGPRPRNHAWISWLAEATHGIHGWLAAGWLARLADSPGADSPDEGDADSRGQMRIRPGRCGSARRGADVAHEVLQGPEVASEIAGTRLDLKQSKIYFQTFWKQLLLLEGRTCGVSGGSINAVCPFILEANF